MKLAYYPGCSLKSSAVEYDISTRRTASILGVDLWEVEDWNCCGATSAHNTDKLLSLSLPARNLAIAEKAGLDVLAPCAACYNRHRAAEHSIRKDKEIKEKVQQIIGMDYNATNQTFSVLEWLAGEIGVKKIAEKVTNPLTGMKAACYYGCLLVRPTEYTGFDDPEDPRSMDNIVRALGAETVEWSHKTECCGAALATSRPDIGNRMIYEILKNARAAGAECIVTACPVCMMNLDMRQAKALKSYGENYSIPVYYVTELLAVACGDSPNTAGTNRHFVEANRYLDSLPDKARAIEEAKAASSADRKYSAAGEGKESAADLQKKIDAMIKGIEKNPDKMALRLIPDEEKARVLTEVITGDEKKIAKLAELMITDKEKATKVAEAFVTGELKKREKTNV